MKANSKPVFRFRLRQYLPDTLSLAIFGIVFLLVIATGERVGAGWAWDFANGIGFAAVAGMVYVFMQHRARIAVRYHRTFSYVVVALVGAHALMFLTMDPLLLEYLKPGAPAYMWSGGIGFLLMVLLILSAGKSGLKQAFVSFPDFRWWHRRLSWLALAATACHVVISGLYIRGPVQFVLLAMLLLAAVAPGPVIERIPARGFSALLFLSVALLLALVLAFVLNSGAS